MPGSLTDSLSMGEVPGSIPGSAPPFAVVVLAFALFRYIVSFPFEVACQ
jgi:hypothetical protein